MATYYVGIGGDDGNNGTTWALRKATLNGAEDIPIAAGDTVYVGPGEYDETLTLDVSGSSGSPITYIGDYDGSHTDGTGGTVRFTNASATSKDYRTFESFRVNGAISVTTGSNWIIDRCFLGDWGNTPLTFTGTGTANAVRNCFFSSSNSGTSGTQRSLLFTHSSTVDNAGHVIENCVFLGGGPGIRIDRVGGIEIRNCGFYGCQYGVRVVTALAAGQTVTVHNSILTGNLVGVQATTTGELLEDYNTFTNNSTARTNVATGANSITTSAQLDARWFFEMVNGGNMVTPFDLASYSGLVELNSGSSPPSADMRGTTVQGTYREWGPLEYDATLDIEAGTGGTPLYRRAARILGG